MNDLRIPELTAYCGLDCAACQIYLATREPDRHRQKTIREEVAGICRSHYSMEVTAEDVGDCDGCRQETGRLFSGCAKCEIRYCARRRGMDYCLFCPDYTCELLDKFKLIEGACGIQPGYYGEGA